MRIWRETQRYLYLIQEVLSCMRTIVFNVAKTPYLFGFHIFSFIFISPTWLKRYNYVHIGVHGWCFFSPKYVIFVFYFLCDYVIFKWIWKGCISFYVNLENHLYRVLQGDFSTHLLKDK